MQITSFNMDNNYIYSYRLQPLYMIEFEEIETPLLEDRKTPYQWKG